MRVKNALIAAIVPLITLLPQLTPIATAQSRSDCNKVVIGRERGSQVNMRTGIGTDYEISGYVLVGQQVNMLIGPGGGYMRERDNQGALWHMVEYLPSQTRGWIRQDFIAQNCIR